MIRNPPIAGRRNQTSETVNRERNSELSNKVHEKRACLMLRTLHYTRGEPVGTPR